MTQTAATPRRPSNEAVSTLNRSGFAIGESDANSGGLQTNRETEKLRTTEKKLFFVQILSFPKIFFTST